MKLFAVLLLLAGIAFAESATEKAHKTTKHIGMGTITGAGTCGATAIGLHALVTATHCEEPTDVMEIEGVDGPVTIKGHIRDGADHSILFVDATFTDYADINLADPLAAGENVFLFGNPGPFTDIYRRGYIAGVDHDRSFAAALSGGRPDVYLFDLQDFYGDSGSAVFNDKGEIIALISQVIAYGKGEEEAATTHIQFAGAWKLQFTAADLAKARAFAGK